MSFRIMRLLLLFLLSMWLVSLNAQDQYCISVDPVSGVVSVTCHPVDYTQVTFYEITYSDISGFFSGSFNAVPTGPEDTYLIAGTNGKVNRFLVEVIFHPSVTSPYGHTISSMKLAVTPLSTGIARLDWNSPDPAFTGVFSIERYEAPSWQVLRTLSATGGTMNYTYNDTITYPFCDLSQVDYRIRFDESPVGSGCQSVSNLASGTFSDQTQPLAPSNDTASIVFNPAAPDSYPIILGWTDSPTNDVVGYNILRSVTIDGTFEPLAFVAKGVNQYTDLTASPCSDTLEYYYAIVATDGCNIGSPNIYHAAAPHNLILHAGEISSCEKSEMLNWNEYTPMPGGLGGYIILRSVNNGTFEILDTVNSSTTLYSDTSGFINGNTYTYMVRAFSQNGTGSSSSCRLSHTYNGPVIPDVLYIASATVVNDDHTEVHYFSSPADRIKQLVLERSDNPSGPYAAVTSNLAPENGYLPAEGIFSDPSALVHQQSYYYRLSMIDSCAKQAMLSENTARSLFLTCAVTTANTNLLNWNEYTFWQQGVDRYEVFRTVNGIMNPATPLAVITSPPLMYEDDPNSILPTANTCYYVTAYEAAGNPNFSGATSLSNTACPVRDPVFYMPNAFRPDGTNNRFRPVQAFIDPGSFTMLVYNKWGQLIFETHDLQNGWNGQIKGETAPFDVYMYRVNYRSLQGESFEKRGLVTLVR